MDSSAWLPTLSSDDIHLTEETRTRLGKARIAVPGLGGVGGGHVHTLAALGVKRFHLADLDEFELANLNRQAGATLASLGRPKVQVLAEAVSAYHPGAADVAVRIFPSGISAENIDEFLEGVDVVVDGIEFFAIRTRRMLYQAARRRGVPVVHAGPLGYGATVLVFLPQGTSFDEHFQMDEEMTEAELLMAHALGHGTGFSGDIDPERIDVARHRGPALSTACFLCSAAAGTEVLKLLSGQGTLAASPQGYYLDLFRQQTFPLVPQPSLTRSPGGRKIREIAFQRFGGLRRLHDQECALRAAGSGSVATAEPPRN